MRDHAIQRYLEDLASGSAEPGGGSATALAAAMGAALVSMVCRLTLGQEAYRAHEEEIRAALAASERLRAEARGLAEEDAAAYGAVTRAHALPRGTEQERGIRTERTQEALRGATEIPLRTAAVAARVMELCARVEDRVNRSAASDLRVGGLLARASLDGAALNVRTNLALIHDAGFRMAVEEQLQRTLDILG